MNTEECIIKSAKRGLLNELFSEALSDHPQDKLYIQITNNYNNKNINTIEDINDFIQDISNNINNSNFTQDDVIVTNFNYIEDKMNFAVIDKYGDIIILISKDGTRIMNKHNLDYNGIEDLNEDTINNMVNAFNIIQRCNIVYTLKA